MNINLAAKVIVFATTFTVFGALSLFLAPANAAVINLFSTGVDANQNPLAAGQTDLHWDVDDGAGKFEDATVITAYPSYIDPTSPEMNARWISNDGGTPVSALKDYTFRTIFSLAESDLSTFKFSFRKTYENRLKRTENSHI